MGDSATDPPEVRQLPAAAAVRSPSAGVGPAGGQRLEAAVLAWSRRLAALGGRLFAGGVDLVFPPRCPICRSEPDSAQQERPAPGEPGSGTPGWLAAVCGRCERDLATDLDRCPACGNLAAAGGAAGESCRKCRRHRPRWRRIVVLSAYEGSLREAVLRAKRPSGEDVTAALADLLVRKHRATLETLGIDRVVPVPMHWLRRSLRGTSAADEMAARIAMLLHRPWSRALARPKATRMQNSLPPADRAANVQGAFTCRRSVAGARILLVDDVMTTGATLSDCCRALREAGAASVDVAVAARADGAGHDVD
jgi:ComF family protein